MTGLLVAAYPLGQMTTSMLWGRVSDTYGRKPAILLGLTISVIANLSFGFSRSIGTLMFWRILAGMANGVIGVMRTMTAEIVKERKYQARAFLALPLIFNSGRVAALAIGGCLADPIHNLPLFFGPSGIFNLSHNPRGVGWTIGYPYALPALFNGIVLGVCLVLATLWLKESLPAKEKDWDWGLAIGKSITCFVKRQILRRREASYTAIHLEERGAILADVGVQGSLLENSTATTYQEKPYRPPFRKIWTKKLARTLIAFGLLPLHNSTFLHLFPVFLAMPTANNEHPTLIRFIGGLGLASPTIGLYLATFGICGILIQLFIYPRIQKRIGTLGIYRLAHCIFPIAYLFAPCLSLLSQSPNAEWPAMAAVLFAQIMARTMAIPSTVILLTEAAPQRSVLGTVHGAGNTLSAMSSASGPVIGGFLLAWGIEHGSVGFVWWSWLCLVALAAFIWSFFVRDDDMEDDTRGTLEMQQTPK
jgi:MFS family permease